MVLPSHSGAIPVAILLYCILTHGFHIWNQTFDWFSSHSEYRPSFLLVVRHTTLRRQSVLSSWQALFLWLKPLAYIRQARESPVSEQTDHNMDDADGELHIEVTPLSPPPSASQQAPRRRRNTRRWRALIVGTAIAVALAVIFSGFLPLRTPLTGWALPRPTATSTPAPTPVLLGKVPTNCPPGNPVETFSSTYGPGVGLAGLHVWLVGFSGPQATIRFTTGVPQTPYGWPYKIILAAAPDVTQQIVLAASGMGGSVWFSTNGWEQATSPLILTPALTRPSPDGWRTWTMNFFLRSSGCYYLDIQYGGQEMPGTYFAAGV